MKNILMPIIMYFKMFHKACKHLIIYKRMQKSFDFFFSNFWHTEKNAV